MVKDLPDFQSEVVSAAVEATAFRNGLDADKPPSPAAGDIWLARDTLKLYVCCVAGAWTGFDASILVQGVLSLFANLAGGGYRITNIANPTAAQDAATKAYADTKLANVVEDTTPELGGNLDALTRLIKNLGTPVAATDAARKTEVDTVDAKLDDVSQSKPTRAVDTEYQNTSGKIRIVTVAIYWTVGATTIAKRTVARCGASTPLGAADNVAWHSFGNPTSASVDVYASATFVVPPNYYYKVYGAGFDTWVEWDLH